MYLQNQGIITVDMRYTMANLFFREKMIDPYIVAIDSTLLKAKGSVWHKSSMIEGVIPSSDIDTDER